MRFLQPELEGLPEDVVQAILGQLEQAIRDCDHTIRYKPGSVGDLQYVAICARLSAVVEFAQRLREQLGSNTAA